MHEYVAGVGDDLVGHEDDQLPREDEGGVELDDLLDAAVEAGRVLLLLHRLILRCRRRREGPNQLYVL